MLDDRNVRAPANLPVEVAWTYDDNATARALLGSSAGGPYLSPYAAPARAEDISGLPPAYVLVGDMDTFATVTELRRPYGRIERAGSAPPSPRVPHAFDLFGGTPSRFAMSSICHRSRASTYVSASTWPRSTSAAGSVLVTSWPIATVARCSNSTRSAETSHPGAREVP
jgi:acetyl esterase/lipase